MDILEKKRKRIELVVKVVALGVIGFVVSPFIFATIQGLVGLLIAGSIGVIAINLAPWAAVKVANWRLKALKHEASLNPIETLENQYGERKAALIQIRSGIKEFHAQVENFRTMIEEFKQKYPEDTRYDDKYGKMQALLANRVEKYKSAQVGLAQFDEMIERKRAEWKIAQAAASLDKAAGVGEDFISKLMADTALDSVQTHLNAAFAELEVSLLDNDQKNVIRVQPVVVALKSPSDGPVKLDLDFDEEKSRAEA